MLSTFTAVDLSKLPAPAAVEPLDYETILGEMVSAVQAAMSARGAIFDATLESDPAMVVLQVAAWRELNLRQRVNESVRAVLLPYAMGTDLDVLAATRGVARKVLVPADPANGIAAVMEPDEELRRRSVLAPEAYTTAGSVGAYLFHALSAHPDVLDASVDSPAPCQVHVSVLSRVGDGTPSPVVLGAVMAALSATTVRPLTDLVQVAARIPVDFGVSAQVYTFPGPDYTLVLAESRRRLDAYVSESARMGRDITRSAIIAALHAPGVQRVTLAQPLVDLVVGPRQAARCMAVDLQWVGIDE